MKRIKRELAYEGTVLKVYRDYMEIKGQEAKWDFVHNRGGATVVPVLPNGDILMVRQYRNAIDRFTLELPAGAFDSENEEGIDCIRRELEEETGYYAGQIERLITIRSMVAFSDEKVELFVATDLVKTVQNLDEQEEIEVQAYPIKKLKQMIYDGELEDAKTVAGLLAYINKFIF